MDRLLKRGDRFRTEALKDCGYTVSWDGDSPHLNKSHLTVSHSKVINNAVDRKPGGWERTTRKEIDPIAGDFSRTVFRVHLTTHDGGGEGHGPGDTYPNGHHVHAESEDGIFVDFYQSGCFIDMIEPSSIELIENQPSCPA